MPAPGAPGRPSQSTTTQRDGSPQYQSLYRRFRPQRFAEVLGQDHVTAALRNAVRNDTVGHAYLMSGPRGTGKTSSARILAKALNCTSPADGEPCCHCRACLEIAAATSLDVHELDAASNNGVDAMRDLVSRAALGTPGRWKVYIIDEVHMLSTAASNALLKTLEEPPGHVVFVLATTDPQKVIPTIRSRTQQLEFRLIAPEVLSELVRNISEEAGLKIPEGALESAVRRGRGSARDALSALDQVAAAGFLDDAAPLLGGMLSALAARDTRGTLIAVGEAATQGRDPQQFSADVADHLRQAFLSLVAPDLVSAVGLERAEIEAAARQMGLAAVVRAMETIGSAQVDMRDAPDARIHLEVALIKLTHPEADDSPAALLERIDRLERAMGDTSGARSQPRPEARLQPDAPSPTTSASTSSGKEAPAPSRQETPAPSRQETPAPSRQETPAPARQETPAPSRQEALSSPNKARVPTRDEIVEAWGDGLLMALPSRARARFRVGRFIAVENDTVVYALPNETHRSYCEDVKADVVSTLSDHFGTSLSLRLIVDSDQGVSPATSASPAPLQTATDDSPSDLLDAEFLDNETSPAGAQVSPEERLKQAFPGAQEV